jgi:hypothetical protein
MRYPETVVEGPELLPALHEEAVEGGQIPGSPGPRAVQVSSPGGVVAVPEPREGDPRAGTGRGRGGPVALLECEVAQRQLCSRHHVGG